MLREKDEINSFSHEKRVKKYGKKAFLSVHDELHEKYDFEKTQEILGQDMYEGLALLEETYRR